MSCTFLPDGDAHGRRKEGKRTILRAQDQQGALQAFKKTLQFYCSIKNKVVKHTGSHFHNTYVTDFKNPSWDPSPSVRGSRASCCRPICARMQRGCRHVQQGKASYILVRQGAGCEVVCKRHSNSCSSRAAAEEHICSFLCTLLVCDSGAERAFSLLAGLERLDQ